jgi:hypothetical protein
MPTQPRIPVIFSLEKVPSPQEGVPFTKRNQQLEEAK